MKPLEEILENSKIWNYTPFPMNSAFIKLPDCGTCSVIWGDDEEGYEHVSVSPKKKFNTPTWNDMCALKDMFFKDDEEVYQIHPKKSEYVNVIENCLHLWRPIGHELNELVEMKTEEKPRWIPVTEKLPKEDGTYLVAFSDGTRSTVGYRTRRMTVFGRPIGHGWYDLYTGSYYADGCIIAWMPLPEQYRE